MASPSCSFFLFRVVFASSIQPFWELQGHCVCVCVFVRTHARACVCLSVCIPIKPVSFPPLEDIFFIYSLGWRPGGLGFPLASLCRAPLLASRESLNWFPDACIEKAFP